jgi:hypothetical protein
MIDLGTTFTFDYVMLYARTDCASTSTAAASLGR